MEKHRVQTFLQKTGGANGSEEPAEGRPSFVDELLAAAGPSRSAVAAVLQTWGGTRVYVALRQAEARRQAATAMLAAGMARLAVQAALRARFGIDSGTARRDVRLALERRTPPAKMPMRSVASPAPLPDEPLPTARRSLAELLGRQ